MTFFLLTYDRSRGSSEVSTFADALDAQGAYSQLELQFMDEDQIEVVLLSAESEDELRVTHSRFFGAPLLPA